MMQVMCNQDIKRICDGSCGDPCCMQKRQLMMYSTRPADELRAKFEAWAREVGFKEFVKRADGEYATFISRTMFDAFRFGHASRDAEVEALRMDAERWFQLCLILDDNGLSEGDMSIIRDAMNMGSGALERFLDENAAMAKESGE